MPDTRPMRALIRLYGCRWWILALAAGSGGVYFLAG